MTSRRLDIAAIAGLILLAIVAGIRSIVTEAAIRTYPLDLDGWGYQIHRLADDPRLATLFSNPSLWKGPVIPFVFGLVYYIWPDANAPLFFNVALQAVTVTLLYVGLTRLGANPIAVAVALAAWLVYPPFRFYVAYYYAEPIISVLTAAVVCTAGFAIRRQSVGLAVVTGALSGVLLLARPPYALFIAGLTLFFWARFGTDRVKAAAAYALMVALVWLPWPVRNYIVEREIIPFTTEGGMIVFMGFYPPGDDGQTAALRALPEYLELERQARTMGPMEQYRFWQARTREVLRADPLAQIPMSLKKAMRFWMHVPDHSWIPSVKTALTAAVFFPLAIAAVFWRRNELFVQLCAVPVLGVWAVHMVLHSEIRYSSPVTPLMFVLAAAGAETVVKWRSSKAMSDAAA